MAAPDLDVIKEVPGYKVILKAVVKHQIQQLVEQLAVHTDEEAILLTASVADGTLSHLGSESGKSFLEDNEDVKSQFLGFCLKYHHKKKQLEKEKEKERLLKEQQELQMKQHQLQQMQMMSPSRYGAGPQYMSPQFARQTSPRFTSPRHQGPGRGPGMRHEPYPVTRPIRRPLNMDQSKGASIHTGAMKFPQGNNGQVIKIEPDDDETSNQSSNDTTANVHSKGASATTQSTASPSHSSAPSTPSHVKAEASDKDDDDNKSESSVTSNQPHLPTEGLSLDSDLSNLISGSADNSNLERPSTSTEGAEGGSDLDPDVSVKLESISESEMELEITGVEPGRAMMQQYDASMGMNFDPSTSGAMDAGAQGYSHTSEYIFFNANDSHLKGNDVFPCAYCGKKFTRRWLLNRHTMIHTGERPHECGICHRTFSQKSSLKGHMITHFSGGFRGGSGGSSEPP